MNLTNEAWIEQLRGSGSAQHEALSALRARLLFGLRKSFRGRPGVDEAFVEDMVQEALVKILNNLHQFQGRSRFTTWAIAIAVRVGLTELRRRRWKDVSLEAIPSENDRGLAWAVDPGMGPEQHIERKAMFEMMHHIIDTGLTEKQRTALLAELKGMPQAEIGRRMGSNRNAVYKLTHDARKRLRQGLEAAGFGAADLQIVLER